jgi:hypothetical protein
MTGKPVVYLAAALVFAICTYVFLHGNKVFEGKFENELLAWYVFAKGIFCSLSLILTRAVLEAIREPRKEGGRLTRRRGQAGARAEDPGRRLRHGGASGKFVSSRGIQV